MQVATDRAALDAALQPFRAAGRRIAFVPTMGNLHAGHYSLVDVARRHADVVVASIFVNPAQFGPGEDFERYPRTPGQDRAGLAAQGCDLLFLPASEVLYPFGVDAASRIHVPGPGAELEGASRPGHFDGVAGVVARLFNLVRPHAAVFGQKDYQQLLLIRRMVADLSFPIEVIAAPIVRDTDGLALSSRNQYLDAGERQRAGAIHRVLEWMQQAFAADEPPPAVEAGALDRLRAAGLEPAYAVLRRPDDLAAPAAGDRRLIALIAAWAGRTRLLDNALLQR